MASDEISWRDDIYTKLQQRNRVQTCCFQDLIAQHNKVFDNVNALKHENLQLSIQYEKYRTDGDKSGTRIGGDSRLQERIQSLEQKLLVQQEELTELHRRKGENSQQIIDLNILVQEKDKLLQIKDSSLAENSIKIASLQSEITMYEKNNRELKRLNDALRDEHQALQLAFSALEEKIRNMQDENREMVERLINYKAKDADRMNQENDNFLNEGTKYLPSVLSTFGRFRKRHAKMQKDIEEACKDTRGVSPEEFKDGFSPAYQSQLPTKLSMKFDAHDGDVNAVKWSPVDRIVATGGADRKVKLWDISKGTCESKGTLVGSNAAVMAVDFDSTGNLILGASNDFASRVWTVADQRLRHTLTGHSGKVMAAKFLGEASRVVTGSHDRTLKIWDLRSKACIETKFAGSSCNDLVSVDSSGSTIISGHYDKSIRFWDARSESSSNNILFNGKVTSLDLTRDAKYLVCCVRDDTLKLIDLRMNSVVKSFSAEGFKVGCDFARCSFSPDGQYVAVGAADGSLFIWGVNTGKVEQTLKEHSSAVTATGWHPYGSVLASVDRSKKVAIWSGI